MGKEMPEVSDRSLEWLMNNWKKISIDELCDLAISLLFVIGFSIGLPGLLFEALPLLVVGGSILLIAVSARLLKRTSYLVREIEEIKKSLDLK